MTSLVPIALFGWIPIIIVVFTIYPPRRAAIIALLGGHMFLPMAGYGISGLPDYTKTTASSLGLLLGVVFFAWSSVGRFRPRWFDFPVLLLCLTPLPSAMASGRGAYAGLAAGLDHLITWGIPYFVGRCLFTDAEGRRTLAAGLFYGGLAYVPFCLYEIRMSPVLHFRVYGFTQHQFMQTMRHGGYRPMVFMAHGLAVGFWMASTCLAGIWVWMSRRPRSILGVPTVLVLVGLIATSILCKSTGAWALLGVGALAILLVRLLKTRIPVLVILAVVPFYILGRASGSLEQETVGNFVDTVMQGVRTDSLMARLRQEDAIVRNMGSRILFGLGPWGDYRVTDEGEVSNVDALWIIIYGKYGILGLAGVMLLYLLPALLWLLRGMSQGAPVVPLAAETILALILSLYAMECLVNAMPNPAFALVAGGLAAAIAEPVPAPSSRVAGVAMASRMT